MTDFIQSADNLLLVSNRFKELLSAWNLGDVEYLPVQIESFKTKDIVANDYWIINALQRYDAVDLEKSQYKPHYKDPSKISEFQKVALKEDMIPLLPSCFRLSNYQKAIIIDEHLLKAIQETRMSGMRSGDLKRYKTYSLFSFINMHPPLAPPLAQQPKPTLSLVDKLKKEKPKQLVIVIEQTNDRIRASFEKPEYEFEYTNEYLYDLKRATYSSLKKIINQHKDEYFQGGSIDSLVLEDLESGIIQCKELMQQLGFSHFKPLVKLDEKADYKTNFVYTTEKCIQHLFWAGNDKHLGETEQESDVINEDGSINWASEVHRMKEECKDVILQYFEEHPGEEFESLTIRAVEHVGILINDGGPEDSDYFPTNIYSPDIEDFIHKNGMEGEDEYLKHLEKATELLRKDKELKHLFTKSTEIDINT